MVEFNIGLGAFGAQTAQGSSPTKRSPTGLASGVAFDVIFNDLSKANFVDYVVFFFENYFKISL
jgi:hypothetical protein